MIYLVLLGLPLLFGALAFWLSEHLWISLGIALFALLAFLLFLKPWLEMLTEKRRKRTECFRFVSSFVISLALTSSTEKSFEGATSDAEKEFALVLQGIESESVRDRLLYLEKYFESENYRMFLSLFSLYEAQGGELLDVSKGLLDELTRVEENENAMEKEGRASLREYVVMWAISLGIFAFLRYGLANFYDELKRSAFFLMSIIVFFAFFIGSILFYFYVYAGKPKVTLMRKKHEKAK